MREGLPREIERAIGDRPYRLEEIGRSGSSVLLFEDMVLKIGKNDDVAGNEHRILRWLDGKATAPRVIAHAVEGGYSYLLMTRLHGRMACDRALSPREAVRGLARGLRTLWSLDISDCPAVWDIGKRLELAHERMSEGLLEEMPPADDIGCTDFPSLWSYLDGHRPTEEPVFSHGDYCLPNVFLSEGDEVGFLDLGSAGVADRWYDIALCLWSMHYNFCELGDMDETQFSSCKALFFSELGLSEDAERIRYHMLLDSFFA